MDLPLVGDYIAAQWDDGIWYTGKVISVNKPYFKVYYDDPNDHGPYVYFYNEIKWISGLKGFSHKKCKYIADVMLAEVIC